MRGEGDMGSNGGGERWGVMEGRSGRVQGGREWWRVKGEGVVGNDEGRGSNGGGREWWREGELTWARHCLCLFTFVGGRLRSCAFVVARARLLLLVRIRFCSRVVAFVGGGWLRSCVFAFVLGWS